MCVPFRCWRSPPPHASERSHTSLQVLVKTRPSARAAKPEISMLMSVSVTNGSRSSCRHAGVRCKLTGAHIFTLN